MATPCGIPSFRATPPGRLAAAPPPPRRLAASPPRSLPSMRAAALPPMPPLNPKDPFLAKLAAASPEPLTVGPTNPPFLDLFDTPTLMATPAQVERSVSYNEHRPRKPPPDLPSLLLHGRIIYIGMPVGMETEGFTIYDAMMQLKNEVITNRDTLVKLLSKHTGNVSVRVIVLRKCAGGYLQKQLRRCFGLGYKKYGFCSGKAVTAFLRCETKLQLPEFETNSFG